MDKGWRVVTIVKPVQDGGTLVSLIPLFRRVVTQHQIAILAYPTLDSAKDIWTTKVLPILKAYGGIEPTSGGGSQGGAARVVTLPTGGRFMLRAAGGRGESQQASVTGDCIQIDEVDDWPDIHRIELVSRRIEESPDPLTIKICTVKNQTNSNILASYETGTRSRLYYACPDCGEYQTIEWENVKYETDGYRVIPGSERLICKNCGTLINEQGRRVMLANWKLVHFGQKIDENGEVIGDCPHSKHFSIIWTRVESPRKSLLTTCEAYMEARLYLETRGEHGPMKSFFQDYLCRQYTGDIEELELGGMMTPQQLVIKSSKSEWGPSQYRSDAEDMGGEKCGFYARHVAPEPTGARWTKGVMDVQHNRVYWVLVAFNEEGTTWDMCWGYDFARFDRKAGNENEMHQLFDRVSLMLQNMSGTLEFTGGCIDCGDQTDMVRSWVARHSHQWRACRGTVQKMQAGPNDVDGILYDRDGVFYVNVENVREMFQAAIRRPDSSPGAVVFPNGLGISEASYFRHLCSRQSSIDLKTKKKIVVKGPGREDWLDCRIYVSAFITEFLLTKQIVDMVKKKAEARRIEEQNAGVAKTVEMGDEQHLVQERRSHSISNNMHSLGPQRGMSGPQNRRSFIGRNRRW